jgi:hypothetical protein
VKSAPPPVISPSGNIMLRGGLDRSLGGWETIHLVWVEQTGYWHEI